MGKFYLYSSIQSFVQEILALQSFDQHFQALEILFQQHAAALEAEVRTLQQVDETNQWPTAWKQLYNWHFACCFTEQKILRNWAADAAAWDLLPQRNYPNRGNRKPTRTTESDSQGL